MENNMFKPISTRSEKFDLAVTLLFLFGICLHYWGITANMVVTTVNNNMMPVITESHTIIIPDQGIFQHTTETGNLILLSDWIRIDFPFIENEIPDGNFGNAFRWWTTYFGYPTDGGIYMVSIGDLMRWTGGSLIFILLTPLVMFLIPRRMYLNLYANSDRQKGSL